MLDQKQTASLIDITKDWLTTPDADYANKLASRVEVTEAEMRELKKVMSILHKDETMSSTSKAMLLTESWRINFVAKPPTIDEFLSPSWIGATSDALYPYVKTIMKDFFDPNSSNRDLILYTAIGWGKSERNDALVFTPTGSKKIGNIIVGDEVSTPNGKTAKVLQVFPQGKIPLYEVTFKDGRKAIASGEHLWKVTRSNNGWYWNKELKEYESLSKPQWQILTTSQLLEKGLNINNRTAPKWKVPLTKPVYHNEVSHYISPYFLGVLIGDGCLCQEGSIKFTSADKEIVDNMKELCPDGYEISHYKSPIQFGIRKIKERKVETNFLFIELERLQLRWTKSHTKFIPQEYLYDSIENRISLLQGLLDTNGSASKERGRISYFTSSEQLAKDVSTLVRGLGGTAFLYTHDRRDTKPNTNSIKYKLHISFPDYSLFPIFRLSRKQERVIANQERTRCRRGTQLLSIVSIVPVEEAEATCILLDDEDHLYLTDEYIVTHNSLLTTLIALYLSIHLYLMRDMYKLFDLANSTVICIMFVSYSLDKVKDLLIEPFKQIMRASDRFHKCRDLDQMEKLSKSPYDGTIHWTTAGDTNILTMAGVKDKVNLKITSNPAGLLGLTIILGLMTELTFFRERGFTDDYIFRVYNDMKGRVLSRFTNFLEKNPDPNAPVVQAYIANTSYYARTVLDSSPNTMESILDRFIVNEAPTRKGVYLVRGSKWQWQPWLFRDINNTFPVFMGSASKKSKIIGESEIETYDEKDIIQVPMELKELFEDSISKALKDYAGIPSDGDEKLIQNKDSLENVFKTSLKNLYTYINAPENLAPEGLIFEQVRKEFFIKIGENNYEFYRNPNVERFLSVDQSLNADFTGISMCHVEKDIEGRTIYIVDFTICIVPTKVKINLDAIKYFIHDLKRYGKLNITHVSFDIFQSENAIQYLKRVGFEVEHLSVDSSMSPYLSFISYMTQNRVKIGKNIILKNNFKSLIQSETEKGKSKIEHIKGKINASLDNIDWETSLLGYYMKDLSDSTVAAIELATIYANKNVTYIYDPREETQEFRVLNKEKVLEGIRAKFGYSIIKRT